MPPHVRAVTRHVAAHALQVLGCVHLDGFEIGFNGADAESVLQRAQLLERFGDLERRLRQCRRSVCTNWRR